VSENENERGRERKNEGERERARESAWERVKERGRERKSKRKSDRRKSKIARIAQVSFFHYLITLVYNDFDSKHLTAISYVRFIAESEYEVR